jgi:hypothetical protein
MARPQHNNGMQRTRLQQLTHSHRFVRAADAGRYVASLLRIARQGAFGV